MMNLKKTGLVAAAGLLAVSGAFAAQLPGNQPCVVGPNGNPTPPNCTYRTPAQIHAQGLQNQIDLNGSHGAFVNQTNTQGGIYHGEVERFDSTLVLDVIGRGDLEGVRATVKLPTRCETHVGPRDPKAQFQRFDTMMYNLQGATSDANFESVKVTAGLANGLPSPGSTTITIQRDGSQLVNSTFAMNYRIELVGRAGGPFDGVVISDEGIANIQAFANSTQGTSTPAK